MANHKKDQSVAEEVANRMNSFFGEEETFDFKEEKATLDDPLQELKSMILSIDWEITDEGLNRFIDHLKYMENFHEGEKDIQVLLHILGSVGRYIKTRKGQAHPNAVKLLASVYSALEKVMLTSELPTPEKEKIIIKEVMRFKELKEQIAEMKGKKETDILEKSRQSLSKDRSASAPELPLNQYGDSKKEDISGVKLLRSDKETMSPHEAFMYALEEIKELIKSEFRAVRAEIRLWRETDHKGTS